MMFAINREKFCVKLPPSRYELESKHKLILDLSNKLDSQHQQVKTLKQLYSNTLIEQRRQLSDEISFLFRHAPIEYGRVFEDILWKRNYYDCVKFFKKYRRHFQPQQSQSVNDSLNNELISLFRSHLISGIGHYHSLIVSFRKGFHLSYLDQSIFLPILASNQLPNNALDDSPFKVSAKSSIFQKPKQRLIIANEDDNDDQAIIKRFNFDDDGSGNDEQADEEAIIEFDTEYTYDEKFKDTLMFLVHRFFICIGDLARYYVDFFPSTSVVVDTAIERFDEQYFQIASLYYQLASLLQPQLGMPYNQLGTLYANSFYGLDSIYYYFRCLNSKKKFLGIKDNLKNTFTFVRNKMQENTNHLPQKSSSTNGFIVGSLTEQNFQNDQELVRSTINRMMDIFSRIFNLIDELENESQSIPASKLYSNINDVLILFRNALNITSSAADAKSSSRLKPNRLTASNIFQIISITMVLIDQIKISLKKNNIDVNLGMIDLSKLESNNLKGNVDVRGNFLLYISYHFLFQIVTMVIHRESEVLKKMMYVSQNLMDDNPRIFQQKHKFANNRKKKSKNPSFNSDSLRKHYQSAHSFSSDYGDCPNDEAMAELKNRVIQTIQDILDSSENEDDNDIDDDNGEELIILDTMTNDTEYQQINHDFDYPLSTDSKTFDQMLAFMYAESYTPIIKFFCDYLQSNGDFIEILQNMSVLIEYFEQFFNYLNLISEFDLRLILNFKSYLEREFQTNAKQQLDKIHKLIDLFNFINQYSGYSLKDFKQSSPLSSEMAFMNLTEELTNFYKSLFDCKDDWTLVNMKNELTIEKSCYLSIKSMIILGIKLVLLSLDNENFKLMATDYDLQTVHDLKQNKHVRFVFQSLQPRSDHSVSILKDDRYSLIVSKAINKCEQQLIQFDLNDKEVENVCNNNNNDNSNSKNGNITPKNKTQKSLQNDGQKNTPVIHHQQMPSSSSSSKSLFDLEKLPHLLIDPFVYLENLEQIKQIVQQKKAFVIVPKLVTDFLNNLKNKQIQSAVEASDFLHDEFFRGSRMIRFIRNEDRLELEMLSYPRKNAWIRTINDDDSDNGLGTDSGDRSNGNKLQDLALFYELLEHCHHLLVNKVLINTRISTIGTGFKQQDDEQQQNVQITLITTDTNIAKWPSNASTTIAQACGIDIETMDSYLAKQNIRNNNNNYKKYKFNKKYNRHQMTTTTTASSSNCSFTNNNGRSPQKSSSNTHFRPIQFMANSAGTSLHHRQVT
ncbi:uncharacterized protein LOC124494213 [Dermatophagoides farinae]|uniref:uncharacterized protein LOC124494213 n=1 Tax=Dermatophagoides farinae TaxID=6954 RepID=UPI003F60CBF1